MAETLSVRVGKEDYRVLSLLAKEENSKKSDILRDVLGRGIQSKRLEMAIEKFRRSEATAWKAARLAGVSLTEFLDILQREGLEFQYTLSDLKEDLQGL